MRWHPLVWVSLLWKTFFCRLISDRGLPALRTLFDNVRFKGKGHEVTLPALTEVSVLFRLIISPPTLRLRTCGCSCRRWRLGPTGFSPNYSLKSSSTKWSDSARRRKYRCDPDSDSVPVLFCIIIIQGSHLCPLCRLAWRGYGLTCRWRMRITQVKMVREQNTLYMDRITSFSQSGKIQLYWLRGPVVVR